MTSFLLKSIHLLLCRERRIVVIVVAHFCVHVIDSPDGEQVKPVSYTHLDVYKRQGVDRVGLDIPKSARRGKGSGFRKIKGLV